MATVTNPGQSGGDQPRNSLLGIPAELRLNIYDHLIEDGHAVTVYVESALQVFRDPVLADLKALLCTCKTTHNELQDLTFDKLHFIVVPTGYWDPRDNDASYTRFRKVNDFDMLTKARGVTLTIDEDFDIDDADQLAENLHLAARALTNNNVIRSIAINLGHVIFGGWFEHLTGERTALFCELEAMVMKFEGQGASVSKYGYWIEEDQAIAAVIGRRCDDPGVEPAWRDTVRGIAED